MTDPTPEELDALVIWRPITTAPRDGSWFIACTDHGTERVVHFADGEHDRFPVAHDGRVWVTAPTKWAPLSTITALRAREAMIEAAAIERAAKVLNDTGYKSVDDTLNQSLCCSGHMCGCRGASIGDWLAHIIRALSKPGARTLLDQRIAEAEQVGYERGLLEAQDKKGDTQ